MNAGDKRQIDRSRLFERVAAIVATEFGDIASHERLVEFFENYFRHVDQSALLTRPPGHVAKALTAQASMARRRTVGQSLLRVVHPTLEADGWDAGDRSVLMLVTDDKEWLVDTVRLAIESQHWSVAELIHPQFQVVRGADGELLDMVHRREGKEATPEAWMWVEITPDTTDADAKALERAVKSSLRDLDAVTTDQVAMKQRLVNTADQVRSSDHADAQTAAKMLDWMADDRFLLLGVRDFRADGSLVPESSGLGILADDQRAAASFNAAGRDDDLIVFTKDSELSTVRRATYRDYIGVMLPDQDCQRRFLGLFTPTALRERVNEIPMLAYKATKIAENIGYDADSYGGRSVESAIDSHPRDELLQSSVAELTPVIDQISEMDSAASTVTAFLRRGAWGRFLTALIYFPRERYNTTSRSGIIDLLRRVTGAENVQWSVNVGDTRLARLYITLKVPHGESIPVIDHDRLTDAIEQVTRTWDDRFHDITERLESSQLGVEWSDAYKDANDPVDAINDLVALNKVQDLDDMAQIMYVPEPPENGVDFRIKMMRVGSEMVLSDMLPHLTSLGVDIIDERPYDFLLRGEEAHVYDFGIRLPGGPERLNGWTHDGRARFTSTVAASYTGLAEADELNRLVTRSDLTWQQVSVLRAIGRYLRQLGTSYSQPYIASALLNNLSTTHKLIDLFDAKFNPVLVGDEEREELVRAIAASIDEDLEKVAVLDEDRIIRRYVSVLTAMVRTNFFALANTELPSGTPAPGRGALAFKVRPNDLGFMTEPQPQYEIFVYSPQVEGVHLRFGKVARGGIRWSDRPEDYRTEVLGLVRAQMVKNSIIVPVGAKGGFYPRRLAGLDSAARGAEGQASYATFIRGLLSLTDNIVDGQPRHPSHVVVHDDDDTYLVVAADKGTARFSDLANQISFEHGYWLGDAFASGGSEGYDHKEMGITARGAWVSVRRHLSDLGIDPDEDEFTCIGIGDMSGDVFGNGMLRTDRVRLVAALNHMHIFLDPNPDPKVSFAERRRLYDMPRSTWADYRPEFISEGGGVYPRTLKAIPVSPQVRDALGIDEGIESMTPKDMISAILRAPVDLMWNGGIGTWVKASRQTNAEVGDPANNSVRVNANEVRARCVGEGGNLGWTQAARIEYARSGGLINTDFIDNSAGVDSSDHEVNIKILIDTLISEGVLPASERHDILHAMRDDVAQLVLAHNVAQNRALAISVLDAANHAGTHEELIDALEQAGYIHRSLDSLPSSQELHERIAAGQGLTCPELATLLASVKIALTDEVFDSDLPDEPYVADRLIQYFPPLLRERFADAMPRHPLARQIITTVAVNRFVDSQGISAAHRLSRETSSRVADVIRAQLVARNILDAGWLETKIEKSAIPEATKSSIRVDIRHLVEDMTRWLLHEYHDWADVQRVVDEMKPGVTEVLDVLPGLAGEQARESYEERVRELDGLEPRLAHSIAARGFANLALPIVRIANNRGVAFEIAATVFLELSERLGLDIARSAIEHLPSAGRWNIMARASLRDELTSTQAEICSEALAEAPSADAQDAIEAWWAAQPRADQLRDLLLEASESPDALASMSVAVGALRRLVRRL